MKRNFLYFLIALVLALPLAIYSENPATPAGPGSWSQGHRTNHARGLMKMFKMAEALELSDDQLLQLRKVYTDSCSKKNNSTGRSEMFKKLSDPNITEAEVKKIAAENARAAEAKILNRFNMMNEIKRILSAEQMKKLQEVSQSRRGQKGRRGDRKGFRKGSRRGMRSGSNPDKGYGWGHGRKWRQFNDPAIKTLEEN